MNIKKQRALEIIGDILIDYFYYARVCDPEFNNEDMSNLLKSRELTKEELIEAFSTKITEILKENYGL